MGEERTLEQRLAVLEAERDVRAVLHRYLYCVDRGDFEALRQLYAPDAVTDLMNFPPGSGEDMHLVGHEGLASVYGRLRPASYRHHSANACVTVADDASTATLSSYFLTTREWGMEGGMYEGELARGADGAWLITSWRVSSQWGWKLADMGPAPMRATIIDRTLRGGHPA